MGYSLVSAFEPSFDEAQASASAMSRMYPGLHFAVTLDEAKGAVGYRILVGPASARGEASALREESVLFDSTWSVARDRLVHPRQ